tara:strand:- start:5161 stop:5451 length:291 start_codon:yes stop_codon:yes gene_type:complete
MKKLTTQEFDSKCDAGESIDEYIDWKSATREDAANLVKTTRAKTGLTQKEFAEQFDLNLRTLQEWELGRKKLSQAVISLMRIISYDYKHAIQAIKS